MAQLRNLDFTDIYVRTDSQDISRYSPTPRRGASVPRNLRVPEEFDEEITVLRGMLSRQQDDDFSLEFDGMRMRGSRCSLFADQRWVALRRLPMDPPRLSELGFRPEVLTEFLSWGRRTGLVVIGGATRVGKTTTAVGILTEFLHTFGGVAFTIEDPIEYYLQGEHGDAGYCFQRQIQEDPEWGEALKTALRWAPRYIFLGEVRTSAAAERLLRAATSDHLVICTVHGGSVEQTLGAILQSARAELGETAAPLLADGLCAVVHQSLPNGRPNVRILTTDPTGADPVRTAVRSGKLHMLGTQISQQAILRKQGAEDTDAGTRAAARITAQPGARGPQPAKKKGWLFS
jgi:twitching motility protein PilT